MSTIINASTSSGLVQTADTSGTLVLQSNGTTMQTIDSTGSHGQLKSGTAVASTSGTSIDFTSIPSWVKRITVIFGGVSLSSTSNYLVQIGSGSVTSSGYAAASSIITGTNATTILTSTAGFVIRNSSTAAHTAAGHMVLTLVTGNTWVASHSIGDQSQGSVSNGGGLLALSGTLDRVRITTVSGTDTFDAGSINILYEG